MRRSVSEFLRKLPNPAVSASVSCMDVGHWPEQIHAVENSPTAFFHYDVVDGVFNRCFILGDVAYRYLHKSSSLPIELHLAVCDPQRYIEVFADYGLDYVAVHYEIMEDPVRTFQQIRAAGALPVLAYRAETPPGEDFVRLASQCAWVLKLTVNPGFSGQKIQSAAIEHIQTMAVRLRTSGCSTRIQADGNVNKQTIGRLRQAGASIFTGGTSGVFNQKESVCENVKKLMVAASYESEERVI